MGIGHLILVGVDRRILVGEMIHDLQTIQELLTDRLGLQTASDDRDPVAVRQSVRIRASNFKPPASRPSNSAVRPDPTKPAAPVIPIRG